MLFSSFFIRIKTIISILFDKRNNEDVDDDLENGTENLDSDEDKEGNNGDNEKEDYFPLILGNTEESHLMSVFRAQVNVSEARINVLEEELKKFRQTQGREVGLKIDTGFRRGMNRKTSGSSTSSRAEEGSPR